MNEGQERGLIWDLPVRVIHWLLVLSVAGAWATQKIPGDWFRYHLWCGYTVLVLVVTRLIWGLIGTRHARFANFVKGPPAIGGYLRALRTGAGVATPGHNPLGALMVLLLLAMLLGQAVSGLFANDEIANSGPLFGYVTVDRSNELTSIHSKLFDFLLAAIALHVAAAFGYLLVKHENLIGPMWTGRKSAGSLPPEEFITRSRSWLAVLVAALVALAVALVVRHAPEASVGGY